MASELLKCNVCEGTEFVLQKSVPLWATQIEVPGKLYGALTGKQSFDLIKCIRCSLIFLHPMPTHEEYFKIIYSFADADSVAGDIKENTRLFASSLDLFEPYRGDGKILDIGIGRGGFLYGATQRGWNAFGLDTNDHYIRNVSKLGITHLRLGTLSDRLYEESSFDCIHLSSVLEHLPNPHEAVVEIFRLLKPKGVVLFSKIPNIDGFYHQFVEHVLGDKSTIVPYDFPLDLVSDLTFLAQKLR